MTQIFEAFDSVRREKGEVVFSATSLNDPHVKKIIDTIVSRFGVSRQEIVDDIQAALGKFNDIASKSPILYETIQRNAVEQEIFKLIEKHKIADGAPVFSEIMFSKLERLIKIEHDQFFPLRNFIDHKYLYDPVIIFVPSKKEVYKQYNSIETAAATPTGQFIFCKPFMQKLIDYAFLKGIKPKGKKYISNGGEIPDEYAYIEFLVIHEFMHYTYADFHYQKKLKANPTIINWVGDFRTNYLLVKSGYEQIPIGLFNDNINYDRQKTYKEMYDIVEAEFKKLNKDQQQQVSNAMDKMGDDHQTGSEQESGEGSGEPQDGDGAGKPQDGEGEQQKGKGKGQPGEDKEGEGDSDDGIFDELDKNNEEIEKKMGESKEVTGEKVDPDAAKKRSEAAKTVSRRGTASGGGQDGESSTFDYSKIRPTFTWKRLLSKMIADSSENTEETYQKPNRRNITGVHLAQQIGSAPMKPGEMPSENQLKLCFIVDSSGSMSSTIDKVYANLNSLVSGKANINKSDFFLIKFSDSHHIYQCNFKRNSYKQLSSLTDKKPSERTGTAKELFSQHFGYGTHFGPELVRDATLLAMKKYNILVISDSDILADENFTNLKKLIAAHKNIFVILDSRSTFEEFSRKIGQTFKNVTYFE